MTLLIKAPENKASRSKNNKYLARTLQGSRNLRHEQRRYLSKQNTVLEQRKASRSRTFQEPRSERRNQHRHTMMKLATVILFGAAVSGSVFAEESRQLQTTATLAEKWNITNPTFDYAGLSFDLDYGISDWIMQGMVSHGIYDENCKEGNYAIPSTILSATQSALPNTRGNGLGRLTQQLTIAVNPATITTDANIYEETVVNGQQFAVINFCVRLNLSTGGDSSIEVNFHETLVTLNVDLTDGFTIADVNVAPREKLVKTANQAYEVEGYQCDRNYAELSAAAKATTRNQGAIIRVCVRPTLEGRTDGIYMREIQSFAFSRTYVDGRPAVNQDAIVGSLAADNGLTDLFCENGWEVCMFETILFAAFYRDTGVVAGSGIASMQFGGSVAARRLRRNLQADGEEAAVAEFEVDFETIATTDAVGSGAATNTGIFAMTFLALAGAIAVF